MGDPNSFCLILANFHTHEKCLKNSLTNDKILIFTEKNPTVLGLIQKKFRYLHLRKRETLNI